jgi:ligand-binding sensor protein
MFWRYAVPLIIAGVFACILIGWVVIGRWQERMNEEERIMQEQERKWREEDERAADQ